MKVCTQQNNKQRFDSVSIDLIDLIQKISDALQTKASYPRFKMRDTLLETMSDAEIAKLILKVRSSIYINYLGKSCVPTSTQILCNGSNVA